MTTTKLKFSRRDEMKTRIVVMSLIFVVAFMATACNSDIESKDESRQEKETTSPSTNQATKSGLKRELEQAGELVDIAKSALEQGGDDAEAKAKRALGYPAFVIDDFKKSQGFISKLNN